MSDQPDRPRFIERAERAKSPEEARQRRSTTMIGLGVIAFLWGFGVFIAGAPAGIVLALLGVGLLVGGLVIRR